MAGCFLIVVVVVVAYIMLRVYGIGTCKPCDSCKYLKQKGNGWKYRCMCKEVYPREFDRAPSFCRYHVTESRKDEIN